MLKSANSFQIEMGFLGTDLIEKMVIINSQRTNFSYQIIKHDRNLEERYFFPFVKKIF